MKVLVGGPFNKGKFLVGASSWHCETSRRFVDRRSAGRGAGECVISSCVLLAAVSLLSRSVGPQPPPRQHGGRGRGPTRALSPAGGGYHSTTYTLTTRYTIQDVCRQAARARRPRGRAAERSLLFVRFKVGGSQVSAGCGRLEPRNKGAGERFGDSHEVNEQSSRFLQIALLMIQNAKYY